MTKHHLDLLASDSTAGDAVLDGVREFEAPQSGVAPAVVDADGSLAPYERDQLARDLAEIERATAALRKAEPALESWARPLAETMGKPHPVWLLVGVLWLSTALATFGAVVAISALVGVATG